MTYTLANVKIAAEPRPYQDWPQATIHGGTKLGAEWRLWATSGTHVGISVGSQDEPPHVSINGVPYRVRMDFHLYPEGWGLAREKADDPRSTWHAILASRADTWGDASEAARRFLRERIAPAVIELIESPEFAPILSAARRYSRAYSIKNAEAKLAEAENAHLEALRALKAAKEMPND